MMLIENNRLLNLGAEDDAHSIQNQEIDVTFPDSVDDRSGANYRTNVNSKLATKNAGAVTLKVTTNQSRLNNDLNPNESPSKTTLSSKGLKQGVLRNNQTEEALVYKTVDSADSLKPNRISEFKHSLVTGASTTESKELPALHQKHLIKNINAQANHYGLMIEQQKRKIM